MFARDDEVVAEYLVHQDDELESEMICVADKSKIYPRRALGELEPRKE